ncbi:MAG: phage baseplate assembly protein V [Byssovorax sp.]
MKIYGVVVGLVTTNQDPSGLGQVKVKFPWLSMDCDSNWARVMAPMAGGGRGVYMLPEVGDEVLVMFEQGEFDHPYVLGALWNGVDAPPTTNDDGKNNLRIIKSRSGHTFTLDDTEGSEKITVVDRTGKTSIVLDSTSGSVAIQAEGDITLSSKSGAVAIQCQTFSVKADASYSLEGADGALKGKSRIAIDCLAGVSINSGALEVK